MAGRSLDIGVEGLEYVQSAYTHRALQAGFWWYGSKNRVLYLKEFVVYYRMPIISQADTIQRDRGLCQGRVM